MSTLQDFLADYYNGVERGCLVLSYTSHNDDFRSLHFEPAQAATMAAGAEEIQGSASVYIHTGIRKEGVAKRGRNDDVTGIVGLWGDLDIVSKAHPRDDLPPTIEDACKILDSLPTPTYIVDTGNGLQAHWLFREPWMFDDENEREEASNLLYAWRITLQNVARRHGFYADRIGDLARAVRCPFTLNHKNSPPNPVTILEHNDVRYNPNDFEDFLDITPPPANWISGTDSSGKRTVSGLPLSKEARQFITKGVVRKGEHQRATAVRTATSLHGAGYSEEDAFGAVWQGVQHAGNLKPKRPWKEWEVRTLVNSVYNSPAPPPKPLMNPGPVAEPSQAAEGGSERRLRFPFYSDTEINHLPDPEWLIEYVMLQDTLVAMYGPTNHGKSFVALDMAMCIGTGLPWKGHEIEKPGKVIYIYSEGANAVKLRANAWKTIHGFTPDTPCNVWFVPASVDFTEAAGAAVESFIQDILQVAGNDVSLVIVDTLARNFGAANENSTQDMNLFVMRCDRIRLSLPGSTVMVVHHTGHDPSRERGSVALKGAMNTHLRVNRPNEKGRTLDLVCQKQKDGADAFKPMKLMLTVVPLGKDAKDRPITSCVVESATAEQAAAEVRLTDSARKQLQALVSATSGLNYTAWAERAGCAKSTFKDNLPKLLDSGLVTKQGESIYKITPKGTSVLSRPDFLNDDPDPDDPPPSGGGQDGNACLKITKNTTGLPSGLSCLGEGQNDPEGRSKAGSKAGSEVVENTAHSSKAGTGPEQGRKSEAVGTAGEGPSVKTALPDFPRISSDRPALVVTSRGYEYVEIGGKLIRTLPIANTVVHALSAAEMIALRERGEWPERLKQEAKPKRSKRSKRPKQN